MKVQKELMPLDALIFHHSRLYFQKIFPEINDTEYDAVEWMILSDKEK